MKAPLLLPVIVLLAHMTAMAEKAKTPRTPEERLQKTLEESVIPKLEFRETTFREALDYIFGEVKRRDPLGRGISFTVRTVPTPEELRIEAAILSGVPGIPGQPLPSGTPAVPDPSAAGVPVNPEQTKITVSLTNIPVIEALRYVTGLANVKFWIRHDGVHIVPSAAQAPMFTRDFRVPPVVFAAWRNNGEDPAPEPQRIDPRKILTADGVAFPPGAAAILNDEGTRLTIHTTKDQFEVIEAVLSSSAKILPPLVPLPIPGPNVSKVIHCPKPSRHAAPGDPLKEIREKLGRIIIPFLDLHDVPLQKAVQTLRNLSMQYDTFSPEGHRGVNVIVCDAEKSSPTEPTPTSDGSPPITLSLHNISMLDAARYVAGLSNHRLYVRPDTLCLQSVGLPSAAPPLVVAEFLILPEMLAKVRNPDDHLPGSEGASSIFLPGNNHFIIRDLEANVLLVREKVLAAWREYYAAEKAKKQKRR